MLLSRLAWQLFWIGSHLQRAEDIARLVLAHQALVNRFEANRVELLREFVNVLDKPPAGAKLTEEVCLRLILTDRDNEASVATCLARVDLDIRTVRGLVPDDSWRHVRKLQQLCRGMVSASRTQRQEVLEDYVRESLALAGVISTAMLRGEGYLFWQLGRQLAGAEMTVGMIHAAWQSQSAGDEDDYADSMLWLQLLKALGMLEAYRMVAYTPTQAQLTVKFLLQEKQAPHSVAACLVKATVAAGLLPQNGGLLRALGQCRAATEGIHRRNAETIKVLQLIGKRIDATMALVHKNYFPPL